MQDRICTKTSSLFTVYSHLDILSDDRTSYFPADKRNKLITSNFVLAFFPSLKKGTKTRISSVVGRTS